MEEKNTSLVVETISKWDFLLQNIWVMGVILVKIPVHRFFNVE